ncbi:hypothetical protein D9M68_921720 [compost metagenome]
MSIHPDRHGNAPPELFGRDHLGIVGPSVGLALGGDRSNSRHRFGRLREPSDARVVVPVGPSQVVGGARIKLPSVVDLVQMGYDLRSPTSNN